MSLEEKLVNDFHSVLGQVRNHVDIAIYIIYFHLTNEYYMQTTLETLSDSRKRKEFLLSLEQDLINHGIYFKLLEKDISEIESHLIDLVNRLPVTYIHIFCIGDKLSCRYYSSVD